MSSRIVTHAYRPKRAPREQKAQAMAIIGPAVVTTTKRERGNATAWVDDGQETSPKVKALVARMMRPHGS
jgi:hypothetical protein